MTAPHAPSSPADRLSTPVDGVEVLGSLSPSRAGDFMTCPLLYRFRSVDRLPEPPSPEAVRGTVVHKALELLFEAPAADRTPKHAATLVLPAWADLLADDPTLDAMFEDETARERWLASCHRTLERYFDLEDPARLEPAERESYVETVLESRLLLRGFIDRLDVAPNGMVRVVDYKTGRSPGPAYEAKALFQMKFYALVVWRSRGVVPAMLQLMYLGNGEVLRYQPDEQDLLATERKVEAVWHAITTARANGDWRPRRSGLCSWCSFKALCPEYGGTPPPPPLPLREA